MLLFAAGLSLFIPPVEAVQIARVQTGSVYFDADDISIPVGIQTVDQTKTLVILYTNADVTANTNDQSILFSAQFEADNSIVISRDGANYSVTVTYYIIEFADGVNVQRGISSFLPGVYTNTNYRIKDIDINTITGYVSPSQPNAFAIVQVRAAMTSNTYDEMYQVTGEIHNAATLRLERSASNDISKTVSIVWQVVEFQQDAAVWSGEVFLDNTQYSNYTMVNDTIYPGINLDTEGLNHHIPVF